MISLSPLGFALEVAAMFFYELSDLLLITYDSSISESSSILEINCLSFSVVTFSFGISIFDWPSLL